MRYGMLIYYLSLCGVHALNIEELIISFKNFCVVLAAYYSISCCVDRGYELRVIELCFNRNTIFLLIDDIICVLSRYIS